MSNFVFILAGEVCFVKKGKYIMKKKMNSVEWWKATKNNPQAFLKWLKDQYHGEVTAATRMRELILVYPANPKWKETVETIAKQEELHAEWVAGLLVARGVRPEVLDKRERYWENTLKQITDWDTGCAVAAHAEAMRLERIRAITDDPETPSDVREVFGKILLQEEFHEKAFRSFTTNEAMKRTLEGHLAGMNELGLVP
jgi:rubrerythrin